MTMIIVLMQIKYILYHANLFDTVQLYWISIGLCSCRFMCDRSNGSYPLISEQIFHNAKTSRR